MTKIQILKTNSSINSEISLHVLNFEHSNFNIVSKFEFSISDFILNS